LAKQFRDCADKNQNLKNYVWHQSFSFPKGKVPTKEQIQKISTTFAKDLGFSDNQPLYFSTMTPIMLIFILLPIVSILMEKLLPMVGIVI